jgi:hypothetical protein
MVLIRYTSGPYDPAKHYKEAAGHYSLDAFLNFFVERIGGHTFIEVPSGRGRTDILILYQSWKTIIETKVVQPDLMWLAFVGHT